MYFFLYISEPFVFEQYFKALFLTADTDAESGQSSKAVKTKYWCHNTPTTYHISLSALYENTFSSRVYTLNIIPFIVFWMYKRKIYHFITNLLYSTLCKIDKFIKQILLAIIMTPTSELAFQTAQVFYISIWASNKNKDQNQKRL